MCIFVFVWQPRTITSRWHVFRSCREIAEKKVIWSNKKKQVEVTSECYCNCNCALSSGWILSMYAIYKAYDVNQPGLDADHRKSEGERMRERETKSKKGITRKFSQQIDSPSIQWRCNMPAHDLCDSKLFETLGMIRMFKGLWSFFVVLHSRFSRLCFVWNIDVEATMICFSWKKGLAC